MMKSRIGDVFSEGNAGSFHTFNALDDQPNEWTFFNASLEDVNKAVELAYAAWGDFRNSTIADRAKLLKRIASELDIHRGDLQATYCQESNLSVERATTELNRTIGQLNLMADYIQTDIFLDEQPFNVYGGKSLKRNWMGIGPVVVFGASNFPFAYSTIGGDSIAAFAAGCPVIVKAHAYHAATSCKVAEIVARVISELGFTPGIFSHLLDEGFQIGAELVKHPKVMAVGFTGSVKGGEALIRLAQERKQPIPVFAEMGSLNPVVVLESALEDTDKWVAALTGSIANDAGQFCTKPGVIIVPENEKGNTFISMLIDAVAQQAPKIFVHPNVFESFQNRVKAHFDWLDAPKWHAQPTVRIITIEQWENQQGLREEFFGPQSLVITYKSKVDLERILRLLEGQLTFSILGKMGSEYFNLAESYAMTLAGRCILNDVPTGVTVAREMVHGGAYPASSDARFTAVGPTSIYRFLRPIVLQNWH